MKCNNCGNDLMLNESFCGNCGTVVSKNNIRNSKNNNSKLIILILFIGLVLLGVGIYFIVSGRAEEKTDDKNNDEGITVVKQIITFNTTGGSKIGSKEILSGNRLEKPIDPVKDGYIFDYWTLDGNEYNFDSIVYSSFELVAVWTDKLLFEVEDIFYISSKGVVVTGKVEKGKVRVGDTVKVMESGSMVKTVTVTGIERFRESLNEAKAGSSVSLILDGVSKDELIKGQILVSE